MSNHLSAWQRQMILAEIGTEGQEKLSRAKVLCVGVGALGSSAALYLAAAGVGHIVIVDADSVELSKLHRQIIHGYSDLGHAKIESASNKLLERNPQLKITTHAERLTSENAFRIAKNCDLIIDGSDNFPTRFLTNDLAFFLHIPLIHAAIQKWEGQFSVFAPHLGSPCYRCLLPDLPAPGSVPSCAEAGVIGALPGILGSMQAMEAIKSITGAGSLALGKLFCYDALHVSARSISLPRDPDCALCGSRPTIFTLDNPQTQATTHCTMTPESITVSELNEMLENKADIMLIDVREADEHAAAAIAGSILIPLSEFGERYREIPTDKHIVLHCKAGMRSARACQFLSEKGYNQITNVEGGMMAWEEEGFPVV